jgi:hypothetical protein
MLHRFMVWQRLKRRSTNTADDMRGELKAACRRERHHKPLQLGGAAEDDERTSTNISSTSRLSTRQTPFTLDLLYQAQIYLLEAQPSHWT